MQTSHLHQRTGLILVSVTSLFRYPIKGFSGEPLASVTLIPRQGFPLDRAYAVTDGSWDYDAATYKPRGKMEFLALLAHGRLATLRLRIDETTETLECIAPNGTRVDARLNDPVSVDGFIDFLIAFLQIQPIGRPRLVRGRNNDFTDMAMVTADLHSTVSVINLATVRDLSARMNRPELDPMRFRANVYIDGAEPWEELNWVGKSMRLGTAVGHVIMPTRRCAITMINPATGVKDAGIPQALIKQFNHQNLGVMIDIAEAGDVRVTDNVTIFEGAIDTTHEFAHLIWNGIDIPVFARRNAG